MFTIRVYTSRNPPGHYAVVRKHRVEVWKSRIVPPKMGGLAFKLAQNYVNQH